jgi:hypothetical protein
MIPPLPGARAGARADVILASMKFLGVPHKKTSFRRHFLVNLSAT